MERDYSTHPFYPTPVTLRIWTVLRDTWVGVLTVIVSLVTAILFTATSEDGAGILPLWGVVSSMMGILVYAFIWTYRNKGVQYKIEGFTVVFNDLDWFVPKPVFASYLHNDILERFVPYALQQGIKPRKLLAMKSITFTIDRPLARVKQPDGSIRRVVKIGVTYPDMGAAFVFSPHVLDPDASGWEIRLLICQTLFPGRPEGEDLAWLTEEGLL